MYAVLVTVSHQFGFVFIDSVSDVGGMSGGALCGCANRVCVIWCMSYVCNVHYVGSVAY